MAVLYHGGPRGDHEELKETQTAVRGRVMGSDVIFAIREESAGGGISYLIATMDSVIEVVANRLRIRGDDFHPCNSQFQSFQEPALSPYRRVPSLLLRSLPGSIRSSRLMF